MSENEYADVVVSTRIRLARNIKGLPFPKKLTNQPEIEKVLVQGVRNVCNRLYKYNYYSMNKLNEIDRLALLERHLISPNLVSNVANGCVIIGKDDDKDISIMINEEDHIRAQCLLRYYDLEGAYRRMDEFDNALANEMDIAFNENLGYLTACPTNLGTGLRASVMLFLPALTQTRKLGSIIREVQRVGLTVRGVYGEGSKSEGYMYQISNQLTLGISELEIIKRVKSIVNGICRDELRERQTLYRELGIDFEDEVMRSYGILKYARKMTSKECMEYLANVKLGASMGIISVDLQKINYLIELAQPANLCHYGGRVLQEEERDELRAKLISQQLLDSKER